MRDVVEGVGIDLLGSYGVVKLYIILEELGRKWGMRLGFGCGVL